MPAVYDASEFVDPDSHQGRTGSAAAGPGRAGTSRILTREELDSKVLETQQRLAELKQVQESLERERAALEELRRRQVELQTGRAEMLEHLTRGIALLEEAEHETRSQAEQMARTLASFREALEKIRSIREETWSPENLNMELTRALTVIENARMEWNSARLKFPLLNRPGGAAETAASETPEVRPFRWWEGVSFGRLCLLGLALTWPVALVVLVLGLLWASLSWWGPR
ncbi:hypothetical protein [Limisphaera sp. 4302-co]|uniref:hypothetical protein n=1 Tax=Limisphaera sp. 4302-co TaxID=3400417 RepID=UPI003C18B477